MTRRSLVSNLKRPALLTSMVLTAFTFTACSKEPSDATAEDTAQAAPEVVATPVSTPDAAEATAELVKAILDAQPDEHKARYAYRNPAETLAFFGIEPGMTVVEALPGGGWYSQLLVPLLGQEGTLIGADYDFDMWSYFKYDWVNEEFLAGRKAWPAEWTGKFTTWATGEVPKGYAATIPEIDASYNGTVDAVLYIRALHNMARFEKDGQFLTSALQKTFELLKPGGVVGIVQHQAPEGNSDEWADGSRGYLKKSYVKATLEATGFEFVSETNVNENELDQPSEEDIVWRLPPSLATAQGDEAIIAKYKAIGESNRMTLLFKKPE